MSNELTKKETQELTISQRFVNKVMSELVASFGDEKKVTPKQKELIQGYFIATDNALKLADEKRKSGNPPITWKNVNLNTYALDLEKYAREGADMRQKNMLFPIPFYDKSTGLYNITLMPGYNWIRLTGLKYALDPPISDTIEVVYTTDKFKPLKKSFDRDVESYEFEITNAFDRGEIVGGFVYFEFANPAKNKLIVMSMKDIQKRVPYHGNVNFWGGKGYNGEEKEGWRDEMVFKTLIREAFSEKHLQRDPDKITENILAIERRQNEYAEIEAKSIAENEANATVIDIDLSDVEDVTDKIEEENTDESRVSLFGD